ncbi:hypothetical protein AUK40_06830 [Candidatus Wirthbacteria bacterium CG2_30_54_11]|uniref:Large ribosomal subunit protein bL25 n=1 Tax=Candidatus Wirthbacteria bacterium CG2_30_54_11 TaxID=1817892 RepID=A0A1J5ITG6_9BACT|nr:MAG: hypothetical protein AUK40_06830 [Candidatus Wirthbacteria bacterium CG2_30_54_11]
MAQFELHAEKREGKFKPHQIVKMGIIPATIYGHNYPSESLQLDAKVFHALFKQAKQTSLIDLKVGTEEKARPVLIHQIQRNVLTDQVIHVEFYLVNLTEKVTAQIPIELTGESPAVKLGGFVFHGLQELAVTCFPQDLIPKITVDISSIMEIGQGIAVKDLVLPSTFSIVAEPEEIVVKVLPPEKEEVEEVVVVEEAEVPELVTKKKGEEEEVEEPKKK